jgi:hypothetical protein
VCNGNAERQCSTILLLFRQACEGSYLTAADNQAALLLSPQRKALHSTDQRGAVRGLSGIDIKRPTAAIRQQQQKKSVSYLNCVEAGLHSYLH